MPLQRANENRRIRQEALREELKSREYLRQIHDILEKPWDKDSVGEYNGKIKGYLALLNKTLPDLKAVEISGNMQTLNVHAMTDADIANRLAQLVSTGLLPSPTPTPQVIEQVPQEASAGVPTAPLDHMHTEGEGIPGNESGVLLDSHPPIQNSPSTEVISPLENIKNIADAQVNSDANTVQTPEILESVSENSEIVVQNPEVVEEKPVQRRKASKVRVQKNKKLNDLEDLLSADD